MLPTENTFADDSCVDRKIILRKYKKAKRKRLNFLIIYTIKSRSVFEYLRNVLSLFSITCNHLLIYRKFDRDYQLLFSYKLALPFVLDIVSTKMHRPIF